VHEADLDVWRAIDHGDRQIDWQAWFGCPEAADYLTDEGKQVMRRAVADLTTFFGPTWLDQAIRPDLTLHGPRIPGLGLTERGRAIVLAYGHADAEYVWSQYVNGSPENIESTLLDPTADIYTLVLRVVAVAAQQVGSDNPLSQADVVAVLANSFAAHQNRVAGRGDAFEPAKIASVLASLTSEQLVQDDGSGLRLTPLGAVVAESGLAVRSAVAVASAFRRLGPDQLNRATIIAAAQVTEELDDTRLTVNIKGVRKELGTFITELQRQGVASAVLDALSRGAPSQVVVAARAKKAVACLLWMQGVPAAQLERIVMQHYFDRSAIGPIRTVASRTQDVIGTILDMAAVIHPTADLARLADLLPVQLELGVPAELAPLATAGAGLVREHYLNLMSAGLTTPELTDQADDETLLKHVGGSRQRLRTLREAVKQRLEDAAVPTLAEALPLPSD
jgi:helicase